jgi:hypothetical protein
MDSKESKSFRNEIKELGKTYCTNIKTMIKKQS